MAAKMFSPHILNSHTSFDVLLARNDGMSFGSSLWKKKVKHEKLCSQSQDYIFFFSISHRQVTFDKVLLVSEEETQKRNHIKYIMMK